MCIRDSYWGAVIYDAPGRHGAISQKVRYRVFRSGSQEPRASVSATGRRGYPKPNEFLIEESLQAKVLLCNTLGHRSMMWKWIANSPGLDITIASVEGKVVGASISLDAELPKLILTFLTAVDKRYRGMGVGVGLRAVSYTHLTLPTTPYV